MADEQNLENQTFDEQDQAAASDDLAARVQSLEEQLQCLRRYRPAGGAAR